MDKIIVAATQMACQENVEENIKKGEELVRESARRGANIVLLQELFSSQYFPQQVNYGHLLKAEAIEGNPFIFRMGKLAKELNVTIPVSLYELAGVCRFNTVVMIDGEKGILGKYRKTHIPDDPGYYEKFYFSPGDTGPKVWETQHGRIGVGICWDQWFPELARIMALMGADILLYPTAIGTFAVPEEEVEEEMLDYDHWQNVMLGHSAANVIPVVAANRIGIEVMGETAIKFWGKTFISDSRGNILKEASTDQEEILLQTFDFEALNEYRREICVFRDRRPEIYDTILTMDGNM